MAKFYISDTHLGDPVAIKYQKRPFKDPEEMDRIIISNWNHKVSKHDDVYILGDLISHSVHDFYHYLKKLNGRKHLIIGNHDYHLIKDKKALTYFVSVENMSHVRDKGRLAILCHYPLAEWNGYYKGVWHIYGHIHDRLSDTTSYMMTLPHALNAGCMINDYTPVTFDELIVNNKRFIEHKNSIS